MDIGDWKIHSEPQDTETSAPWTSQAHRCRGRGGGSVGGACASIWMDVDMKSVWQAGCVCVCICSCICVLSSPSQLNFSYECLHECVPTHTHRTNTHTHTYSTAATSGFHLLALHVSNGYVFSQAQDMDMAQTKTHTQAYRHTHRHTHWHTLLTNTHTCTVFSIPFGAPRFSLCFSPFSPAPSLSTLRSVWLLRFPFSFLASLFRLFLHFYFCCVFLFFFFLVVRKWISLCLLKYLRWKYWRAASAVFPAFPTVFPWLIGRFCRVVALRISLLGEPFFLSGEKQRENAWKIINVKSRKNVIKFC